MPPLSDQVEQAFEEARVLVLGTYILLGAQYQAALQRGFGQLPVPTQWLHLLSLGCSLLAFALLLAFVPRHALIERGNVRPGLLRFVTRTSGLALLPFAAAMGLTAMLAGEVVGGRWAGIACGSAALLLPLTFWYGPAAVLGRRGSTDDGGPAVTADDDQDVDLTTKIRQSLVEVRVVLPGAQAMLAFQFLGTLTDVFARLPQSSKWVHLASLGFVVLSVVLLMTPAAFHRLVERGEATARQHRVAGACLAAAMASLAPGMTGGLFVIVRLVTGSAALATTAAVAALVVILTMWFGPALYAARNARARGT
jgi:hypothetical protein